MQGLQRTVKRTSCLLILPLFGNLMQQLSGVAWGA